MYILYKVDHIRSVFFIKNQTYPLVGLKGYPFGVTVIAGYLQFGWTNLGKPRPV